MNAENPPQPMREHPDPTEAEEMPETPSEQTASETRAIIEAATGVAWAHFAARHQAQAAGILRSLGGKAIVPAIIEVLECGDDYEDLVARTNAEANVAAVVAAVAPLVMDALFTLLAA